MSETPSWTKHFSLLDKLRRKKEPGTVAPAVGSSSVFGENPTGTRRDTMKELAKKKERAIQGLMGDYSRLKSAAVTARKEGTIKEAMEKLIQAEGFLSEAERFSIMPIETLDIKEIDEILARYPFPTPDSRHDSLMPETLTAVTPEGREISFNLMEQLKYWGDFYKNNKIDWVSLPETISLKPEQITAMTELMKQGYDKMLIIPENLVGESNITYDSTGKPTAISNLRYQQLHQLMSKGYKDTYVGDNYKAEGSFQGAQDKTGKLRIILTKDVQNLEDDPEFKVTIGKSIEQLEADELTRRAGFSEATYLIYQREYFKRTGKHLDEKGWTWLPESRRPLFGRASRVLWRTGSARLEFHSNDRGHCSGHLGCRFAGSFEV